MVFRTENENIEEKENQSSVNNYKRPRTKYTSESQCEYKMIYFMYYIVIF